MGMARGGEEMVFRTGATATLLICLAGGGGQALAQYDPPPQAYPPQVNPAVRYQPRQPVADSEKDAPPLNAPVMQHPLPPIRVGSQSNEPPASTKYGPALPPA